MEYPEGGGEPENDTVVASFETSHIKVTEWPVATERGCMASPHTSYLPFDDFV